MTTATIDSSHADGTSRSVYRLVPTGGRLLMGLVFLVFGFNGFLHFIPMSSPPGPAATFFGALFATGYMVQIGRAHV
jgi:hypothetical protein